MPLMVDKMLAKGALDGRNEIVSVPLLFELHFENKLTKNIGPTDSLKI